jgi:FAD/FMN-containing dehydrogenase
MGSLHVQWAKSYPFAQALEGQTAWHVLEQFKRVADPDHVINPGVLGLGLQGKD